MERIYSTVCCGTKNGTTFFPASTEIKLKNLKIFSGVLMTGESDLTLQFVFTKGQWN